MIVILSVIILLDYDLIILVMTDLITPDIPIVISVPIVTDIPFVTDTLIVSDIKILRDSDCN